jgi:hypothetical protein
MSVCDTNSTSLSSHQQHSSGDERNDINNNDFHHHEYFCNICHLNSSSFSCHQQHLSGKKHKRKFNLIQQYNKDTHDNENHEFMILKKKLKYDAGIDNDSKSLIPHLHQTIFSCFDCNKFELSYESYMQHKKSKKHKKHSAVTQPVSDQQQEENQQSYLKEEPKSDF